MRFIDLNDDKVYTLQECADLSRILLVFWAQKFFCENTKFFLKPY